MSVGLVLGAGGVVGHAWHAGVLAALDDALGWDARTADVVVGTSAGSVVGALLRADLPPRDVYARAIGAPLSDAGRRLLADAEGSARAPSPASTSRPWPAAVVPASPRLLARAALAPWRTRPGLLAAGLLPRGRVDATVIADGVRALYGSRRWPERPLWVCAVRLGDGHRAVLGRDADVEADVGTAVAASCAIPGYFAPVVLQGHEWVDGGAHSPTNADVLSGLDLDLILVSAPMGMARAALRRPALNRAVRLGHRAALQREVTVVRTARTPVVTFQPGPDDLEVMGPTAVSMDPSRSEAVARQARATTLRRLASPGVAAAISAIPRPV